MGFGYTHLTPAEKTEIFSRIIDIERAIVDLSAKYNKLVSSLDEFGDFKL